MNNFQEKVSFIWSVADLLRGDYKQSEYGRVILPLTVMRRLDCVLEPKKEAVLEKAKSLPKRADEAMYRSDWGRCCFARYLIRLRPDLNPSFFELRHSNPYLLGRDRSFNDSSNYSECERGAVWKSSGSDSPLPEQRAIAALLERNTAQIDAVVAKKRRLIQRLQEKRQALISHAVTKGLDPHAPMKDSGVEWRSLVPKHWVLVSLKYVALIQSGLTLGKKHGEQPLISRPYLRVANVQDGYLDLDEITTVDLPQDDALSYELHAGDVLMTEGGDFDKLGRGYVWEGQIGGCLHQNHVFAVRPNRSRLRSHFLAKLMTSTHGKHYFTSTSQQTTNLATTNSTKLGAFLLPLPPLAEQDRILTLITESATRLDSAVAHLRSSVAMLQEYRQTLISAAVTGKIDVTKEADQDSRQAAKTPRKGEP